MAYKDKDQQREAVRLAVRRHRAKGITGITHKATNVIPSVIPDVIPSKQPDVIPSKQPESQSYNPMMVGYVPPKDEA